MPLPIVKQVNDLMWYLHRRQERRWLRCKVGWWERKRAMGRSRFVWRFAFGWGLSMELFLSLWDYLFGGDFKVAVTALTAPMFLALGWWLGASAWANNERLYERARQDGGAAESSAREA